MNFKEKIQIQIQDLVEAREELDELLNKAQESKDIPKLQRIGITLRNTKFFLEDLEMIRKARDM